MLAELLELLHTSADRWTSLEADVEEWKDLDALQTVTDRTSSSLFGGRSFARLPGRPVTADSTGTQESTLSVTATSQRAVRVDRPVEGGRDVLVVAPDGGILHLGPDGAADVEPNPHPSATWLRLGLLGPMLSPALLGGACRLQVTGTTTVADRECVVATAALRAETATMVQHLLGVGVHRAELAVDRLTGVVLSLATCDDGRPLQRVEARSVRFDAPVGDDAFSLTPPEGAAVADRDRGGAVTLEEAARQVPFTLLAPPPSPSEDPWSALVTPQRPGHPVTVLLHQLGLSVRSGHRLTSVVQTADPAAMPDVAGWAPVGVDDLAAHAWSGHGSTHLAAWKEGTGIWIRDAESPEAAGQLLRSLQPVDAGPPDE